MIWLRSLAKNHVQITDIDSSDLSKGCEMNWLEQWRFFAFMISIFRLNFFWPNVSVSFADQVDLLQEYCSTRFWVSQLHIIIYKLIAGIPRVNDTKRLALLGVVGPEKCRVNGWKYELKDLCPGIIGKCWMTICSIWWDLWMIQSQF